MKDGPARERAIEKLLARKLRAQSSVPGAACLNAQTLAAYIEQSLTPGELSSCESHLAACSRCQEQVAQLVRWSEAELPATAQTLAAASSPRAALLRWAWAAPALVAMIVAGLWYSGKFAPVLRRARQEAAVKVPAGQPKGGETGEVLSREDKSPVVEPRKAEPSEKKSAETVLVAKNEARAAAKPAPPPPNPQVAPPGPTGAVPVPPGYQQLETRATHQEPRPAAPSAAAATRAEPPAETGGVIAPPSTRAHLAGVRAEAPERASEAESGFKNDRLAESLETTPAGKPQTAENAPQLAKEKMAAHKIEGQPTALGLLAERKSALDKFAATRRLTPAGNWRVGALGLIQKTDFSGNWLTIASGVTADLYDIAFATPAVGWAVGQAGTVIRTTDGGGAWEKISVPTSEDLVRITATSEQAARVVTRGGRSLATLDGGKSWKPAQ